jgi:hypothetical protein
MEQNIGKAPENRISPPTIIANEPLPNLALVLSVPVYREWDNGNLLRLTHAMLTQRIPRGSAIEVNYILNDAPQDKLEPFTNNRRSSKLQSADSLRFLQELIGRQGRIISPTDEENASGNLENNADPLTRSLFRLAKEKAASISFSAIDVGTLSPNRQSSLDELGYRGATIDKVRTVGMDYAATRLPQDGIIHLYDCDTIPQNRSYIAAILNSYREKDRHHLFAGIGYQPGGVDKAITADSPRFAVGKLGLYNPSITKQSPQISFRAHVAERLREIVGPNEDIVTANRLTILNYQGVRRLHTSEPLWLPPLSLTSDREGSFDGKFRLSKAMTEEKNFAESFSNHQAGQRAFYRKIQSLPKDLHPQVFAEYADALGHYMHEEDSLRRFYRSTASAFLKQLDGGNIAIDGTGVAMDDEAILHGPNGTILLQFIRTNQHLISTLSKSDIRYLRSFFGQETPRSSSSRFQDAIREYLGDFYEDFPYWDPTKDDVPNLEKAWRSQDPKSQGSFFHPMQAESLALGSIYSMYRLGSTIVYTRDPLEGKLSQITNAERQAWIKEGLTF